MAKSKRFVSVVLAACAAVLAPVAAAGTASAAPRHAVQPAVQAATVKSPIGMITPAENTWLHTHPVNLTAWKESTAIFKNVNYLGRVSPPEFTHWGYWCGYATGSACMNNINGGGAGNDLGYWNKSTAGGNGEFDQYYSGQVDSSYPWGTEDGIYTHYEDNAVYEYYFTPNGKWTGLAVDGTLGDGGNTILEDQNNSADQEWVWDGNNRWVNVFATANEYFDGTDKSVYAGYTSLGVGNGDPMYNQTSLGLVTEWHFLS